LSGRQPVLEAQSRYAREMARVRRDECQVTRRRDRCDSQIGFGEPSAITFERRAECAVLLGRRSSNGRTIPADATNSRTRSASRGGGSAVVADRA
jgi:hypothetical protein